MVTMHVSLQLSKLQERLKDILSLVEQMDITMEGTKSQRNKIQQEIDKVVEDIFTRLNDQLRKKLQGLTSTSHDFMHMTIYHMTMSHDQLDDKRYLKRQACQITNISTEIEGKVLPS